VLRPKKAIREEKNKQLKDIYCFDILW